MCESLALFAVAIDQTVSAILNAAGLKKYEDRVAEALIEVKNRNPKGKLFLH